MASWWELVIPVAGTLAGALMGAGLQARNSIRVLKIQNSEAQRADREKYEHERSERSMRLLEEKRQQYADFFTAYENFEGVADNIPERGQRSPEEMEEIGTLICWITAH